MPIIAKGRPQKDPAPEGVHMAVCVEVHDLGDQESTFRGKTRMVHKVLLGWEIDQIDPKLGEPFVAYRRFTLSLGPRATLTKFLTNWRGKKFTPEELQGFDLEKLLGAPCQIQVQHFHPDDGSGPYANVEAVLPLTKGQVKLAPSGKYVRLKDRESDDNGAGSRPPVEDPDDDLPF